jgi:hypothetical protein
MAMSPTRQRALGTSGCRLAPIASPYRLKNGQPTQQVAVTVSLLWAEPCLRRFIEGQPIAAEAAVDHGYRLVRNYDDALSLGLA